MRSRTCSRSVATSATVRPAVLIGSSTWTSASDTPRRQSCLRSAVRVPCTASGRIGAWASMASRNAPSLNSASSPLAERVPSGKTITDTWASSRARHCASAAIDAVAVAAHERDVAGQPHQPADERGS